MLKYLQQKSHLEWMEELQVVENKLIGEAQSEVLTGLMGASETGQTLLHAYLGDSDLDTWVVVTS